MDTQALAHRARIGLLIALAVWSWVLIRLDYRSGEIMGSFLHRPLLVFHEAGHVIFRAFGEWFGIMGGTLGQLLMPAVMAAALLRQNGDRFGAAIAVWLLGVSLLDTATYVYDALTPQLILLSGRSGEAGGHDWIYLLESLGLRPRAHLLGSLIHALGMGIMLLALVWAAWTVRAPRQYDNQYP